MAEAAQPQSKAYRSHWAIDQAVWLSMQTETGDKAAMILHEYFCGNGFTRRDTKAPLSIPTKPVPVPSFFDVPFDVRETYVRRGVHEFFTITEQ